MGYEHEGVAIVIDNGSGSCKAGFAGDDFPRSEVFTPVVDDNNKKQSKFYVGTTTDAIKLNDIDSKECHAMEEVWRRAFYDLLGDDPNHGGDLKECPVLLAEPPLTQNPVREKTTEIMFETFEVPALYLSMQAVLALYASGRTTGIVLDSGEGVTHAVPISDCYAITPAIAQLNFAGCDSTNLLIKNLKLNNNLESKDITSAIGRDIKEKHCRVLSFKEPLPKSEETYYLPDGRQITIGSERFSTPEALFINTFSIQPTSDPNQPIFLTYDREQPPSSKESETEIVGIHRVIHESISKLKYSKSDWKKMYGEIVLSGGATMFSGLDKRLEAELTSLLNNNTMAGTKVSVSPSKKHSTWLGGSVLASLSTFDSLWCTKEEYEERGKYYENKGYKEGFHPGDIIHDMCPVERPKDAQDS